MAWLTGWNYRKAKTINGTTAGAQSNYQMKLTVHKGSGTDTTTDIYLGTNVRDDFGDVRFTSSDQETLIDYWIESYISGTSAVIWIEIPSIPASPSTTTIYIYYDNSTETTTSNLDATFLASDMTALTEVDPNNKITINNSSRATFTNLRRDEQAYLYKSIPSTTDYRLDMEYIILSGSSSGGNDAQVGIAGVSDTLTYLSNTTNSLYIRNYDAFHISTYRLYMTSRLSGTQTVVPPGDNYAGIGTGTLYYITITRIGTTVTMNIYTNAARTTHASGSPRTGTVTPAIATTYAIPLSSDYNASLTANVGGYIQNLRLRTYTSPEPTFGSAGIQEVSPGNLDISSTPSGAEIYIDDVDQLATTPNIITDIPVGTHSYKLTLSGYADKTGTFDILSGQTTTLSLTFLGSLSISSTPSGAEIFIDDIDQSVTTPNTITGLTAGSYKVTLTLSGYLDRIISTTVSDGTTTVIDTTLILSSAIPVLADTPWPKFHRDSGNTGKSPYLSSTDGTIKSGFPLSLGPIRASPAIDSDGTVYIGSQNGNVYAINPDGSTKWTAVLSPATFWYSGPTIGSNSTLYIASEDYNIYALDTTDGTTRWYYTADSPIDASPVIGSDGTIYIVSSGSPYAILYALNPDGTLKWTYTLSEMMLYGGQIAIGSDDVTYMVTIDDKITAVNPNGTNKWIRSMSIPYTEGYISPAIHPTTGLIYVGDGIGDVYSFTPTGTQTLITNIGYIVSSTPAFSQDNNTLYIGTDLGLHAINLSTNSVEWTYTTANLIGSSAAVSSNDLIYVGDNSGYIYCINPDGSLKWSYLASSAVRSSPAIDSDGTVYVGDRSSGSLYAFESIITCPTSLKYSGDTVTLKATPKDGIGPYYVVFRKNSVTIDPSRLGGSSNPILSATEDIEITRIYTLDDADIAGASGGTIDFSVYIEDSCPTGAQTCTDTCTINIGCVAPVCNFVVT